MATPDVELSVVVPAHDEQDSLPRLVERLIPVLESEVDSFEIVIIDDGSTDDTAGVAARLAEERSSLRLLRLSRNFGHQAALLAGLSRARGEVVIMMDADLQHPPEVIPEMLALWRRGHDIVHTVRNDTKGSAGPLKRWTSRTFYRLLGAWGRVQLEPGMADFRLASRAVVDAVVRSSPSRPFLRGAFAWIGFPQATVPYDADVRAEGRSSYTLGRMLRLAIDGLLSFGDPPLHWPVLAGLATSLLALSYGAYAVLVALTTDAAVPGWASLAVLTSILFGLLFLLLGVLGAYVVAIYRDTRGTPPFVVLEDSLEAPRRRRGSETPQEDDGDRPQDHLQVEDR